MFSGEPGTGWKGTAVAKERILVIEDGHIQEMGSHAELLRQKGHYYRLYTKQFRQQLEAEYDVFKTPVAVAA